MPKPRPNLFIIGAMKSGTTSLHKYLSVHPEIYMSSLKEPSYFCNLDELRESESSLSLFDIRDEDRYLRLFATAGRAKIIGESSTTYTKLPLLTGVPERILTFNPHARFIYIMRDPVQRSISHFWHRMEYEGESRQLLQALHDDSRYVDVSRYDLQLRAYADRIDWDRILLLTTEELEADTVATMQKVCTWLGVDASFHHPIWQKKFYEGGTKARISQAQSPLPDWFWTSRIIYRLRCALPTPMNRKIKHLIMPKRLKDPEETARAVLFLRRFLLPRVGELCRMVKREFPEWRTLYGG
jgi:hypothetical protein